MVNCSQGLVLATTAMVVSTTVAVLAYSRQKPPQEPESSSSSSSPQDQPLMSCLCSSDEGRRRRRIKRQKKRVRFAEDVKGPVIKGTSAKPNDVMKGDDGLELLQFQMRGGGGGGCRGYNCREEIDQRVMPANRAALYSCILRDRANRIACSY